jgi:peptidoglycan/LPS O-acetylase OafA/YrhL
LKLTKSSSILLDLIRGISAQLVVVGHLFSFYNIFGLSNHTNHFLIQNFGVVMFFILSGFLIGYSVENKSSKEVYTYRHFFIDRFSRIFIAYIPALFVIGIIDLIAYKFANNYNYKDAFDVKTFIGNMFMLQDFPIQNALTKIFKSKIHITMLGSARPLWTVAVEWWIYLFFGFIYFKKITHKSIIFLLPLMIVPFFRIGSGGNGLSVLWFVSLASVYLLKKDTFKGNHALVIALSIAASFVRLLFNNFEVFDLAFSIPLLMALFVYLSYLQTKPIPNYFFSKISKTSSPLAAFSFSLYLLHYTIIEFVRSLQLDMNIYAQVGLLFILCNVISWLFAKATEYNYHKFRVYLTKKFL